jgi:hypothetical protein
METSGVLSATNLMGAGLSSARPSEAAGAAQPGQAAPAGGQLAQPAPAGGPLPSIFRSEGRA